MTHNTIIGQITQVSFAEFLALVPELALEDGTQSYRFITKARELHFAIPDEEGFTYGPETPYDKKEIWLLPEYFDFELIMKQNLVMQAGDIHLYNATMEELVTEMAETQEDRFGLPTHLISIENRWLMANPEDFLKLRSNKGVKSFGFTKEEWLSLSNEEKRKKPGIGHKTT